MKPRIVISMAFACSMIPFSSFAAKLSLDEYLQEVATKNQGFVANTLTSEGATARLDEGKLIFRPSLFIQGEMSIDKKPVANPQLGTRTDVSYATMGIAQQFDFGLNAKLGYTLVNTELYNATAIATPEFNDGAFKLELSQSLWKNWAGSESQAQSTLLTSQAKVTKYASDFTVQSMLTTAESLYWSLSQMRKVIQVQQENLSRAKHIRDWNERRINSGLAERSDFLQADANYKTREYELQNALQQENMLQRSFNSMRGIDSGDVPEELAPVISAEIIKLNPPEKVELRADTLAALEQQNLARANATLAIERNKPTFEIYGAYTLNGRAIETNDAISNSFKTDHPTSAIGLRFVAPLSFGTMKSAINGYKQEQLAAELNYQRKLFDQDREWNDLLTKFNDLKIKLNLVEKITTAQRLKTSNERNRLNNGRTTTFQVLAFELESAAADLLRIQTETDLLNIYSQLKLFSVGGAK